MTETLPFGKGKLGFGLMRLPRLADGTIDVEQVSVMTDKFLEAGLTYFDTAYVYEGSEAAAGKALCARHPRDSYTLATKINAGMAKDEADAKQQIHTSLERTGAGYFDFCLLHALGTKNRELYDKYGLWDYVKELKEQGLIRHYGFSFHDMPAMLEELLTEHPDVEFVQLQINYADWENPDVRSRECLEICRKHGKPVVVMEPVKGGALANPPESVQAILKAADPEASAASWAVRFAASQEGIAMVLSGMSSLAQMEDNLSYMDPAVFRPLDEAEEKVIEQVREALAAIPQIPCTSCHYCTGGCPMNIPIPDIFGAMNRLKVYNDLGGARQRYKMVTRDKGKASDCIQCGQCETACPQHLHIIELLQECAATLED
ncbi:MAG: aldo/keto reductase [Solobacterium sp.]|nr:aldo/keto reductase [Solobacterium sp.]